MTTRRHPVTRPLIWMMTVRIARCSPHRGPTQQCCCLDCHHATKHPSLWPTTLHYMINIDGTTKQTLFEQSCMHAESCASADMSCR
jgi:hypothetical protein